MHPERSEITAYLLALSSDCEVGDVGHQQGKKCGNTPSKRKYKNCWIRGFNMPKITNDYFSEEWADFAQMSVYGAIVGRKEWERNNNCCKFETSMNGHVVERKLQDFYPDILERVLLAYVG